jgi:hypothetical protein
VSLFLYIHFVNINSLAVFNTLQKISRHHAMLRKICFGASASKICGLVESELPEWYGKLANEKKPVVSG